ncbi:MAG: Maf family protein [Kiritimatiellia bacterium]
MQLRLASRSPRRKAILEGLGLSFEISLPTCQEVMRPGDPAGTVGSNARFKWLSVKARHPQDLILAADTVVAFNGRVLGKPSSAEEAQEWLLSYAGKSQTVYTAIAINLPERHEPVLRIEATSLTFADYGLAVVQDYLDRVQPWDRAGAYDINEYGEMLIASRIGSYSNVMGLPQGVLRDWLRAHSILP